MAKDREIGEMTLQFGKLPQAVIDDFVAKRYDACLAACEEVLRVNPTNGNALLYAGIINRENDNWEAALKYFTILVEFMPKFFFAWEYKSQAELKLKKYEAGILSAYEHIGLVKHLAIPWCYAALGHFCCDRAEFAFKVLDMAEEYVTDNKEKSHLVLMRGMLQERKGNKDGALMSYLAGQVLNPEDSEPFKESIYKLITE